MNSTTERNFVSKDVILKNKNSTKTNLGTNSLYHNFLSFPNIKIVKQK